MAIRSIRLPQDLLPLEGLVVDTFQYPENPEWSLRSDEQEDLADWIRSFRRLWPAVRVLQAVSTPLRDLIRGHLWEEDGTIGGVTIVRRRGSTALWNVGLVGVLPGFRLRGIARRLLEASIDAIRSRGGTRATLGVINGNVPAQALYRSLGFEEFNNVVDYEREPQGMPAKPPLPEGYTHERLREFEWRIPYELADRITPERLREYEPVEPGRFRSPRPMRLLAPILRLAQRRAEGRFAIRHTASGLVIGRGRYGASKRGRGVHSISAVLDPEHAAVAPYIVGHLLREVISRSPELRVEFAVHAWMAPLVRAAEDLGFVRRLEYRMMGLIL